MATENNVAWQLEDFVDSLVVELDKTRETLAVKAINKPLTYTVKDMALDLNVFPSYDGDQMRFTTAQPGQEGASKVTIQLGSITDQQVRATTKLPSAKNDLRIEQIPVDNKTKKQLRKLGVTSVDDLQQLERKNVDLQRASDEGIDYKALANQIQKSKRNQTPPKVKAVSLSMDEDKQPYLRIQGENLAVDSRFSPVAVVNHALAKVMSSSKDELKIQVTDLSRMSDMNEIILTFDPFAIVKLNVKV